MYLLCLSFCTGTYIAEFANLAFDFEDLKVALKQIVSHAKYGLRSHIVLDGDCSGDALHCCRFALGAPCDRKSHKVSQCVDCINFAKIPDCVRLMMNAVANSLAREHASDAAFASTFVGGPVYECHSMSSPITFCHRTLNLYHRHVMRGAWQNREVEEVIKHLEVGEVLVTLDHKQKIEAVNFNESSEEYYGKKGISLLGFVLRWRDSSGGCIETHFIDAVSCNSKQDALQVQNILSKVLPMVKTIIPAAQKAILLSDHGPSFTSKDNIKFVHHYNKSEVNDIKVVRWLFFEAQCGKTILDCHFSFVGISVRRFARKVRPVKIPEDVFDALVDGGGIANTSTCLIRFAQPEDVGEAEPKEDDKVDGIRKIHDICFEGDKVVTFHFSNIAKDRKTYEPSGEFHQSLDAQVERHFRSPKIIHSESAAHKERSVPDGPLVNYRGSVSPHERRICEALVQFSTLSRQMNVAHVLMPYAEATGIENIAVNAATNSKKKAKLDTDDYRASYETGWAESQQRKSPQMSQNLEQLLEKMVRLMTIARATLCNALTTVLGW